MKSAESKDFVKYQSLDPAQLKEELAAVRRSQFNLRMQKATGQESKSHLIGEARRSVARIKTLLTSKAKKS